MPIAFKEWAVTVRALAEGEQLIQDTEKLIADYDLKENAQELADDIGAVDRNLGWPACHIDWDAAADSLKVDYGCIEFGGYEYWIRA